MVFRSSIQCRPFHQCRACWLSQPNLLSVWPLKSVCLSAVRLSVCQSVCPQCLSAAVSLSISQQSGAAVRPISSVVCPSASFCWPELTHISKQHKPSDVCHVKGTLRKLPKIGNDIKKKSPVFRASLRCPSTFFTLFQRSCRSSERCLYSLCSL